MMSARFLWDRFLYEVRISGLIPVGGRILDVGTGINTTTLELFGDLWEVTPSDINVGDWNAHIPGMRKVDIMNPERGIGDFLYDAIVLSEVLEHVTEPDLALYNCWNSLEPGGVLIISCPFFYRIHEYGGDDKETTEPGLKDYWRFTPNGMAELLSRQPFSPYWVGRLVKDDIKTFPEFYCPKGVVAWGKKVDEKTCPQQGTPRRIPEENWTVDIPDDWRAKQLALVTEYERSVQNVGGMEPV